MLVDAASLELAVERNERDIVDNKAEFLIRHCVNIVE